MQIKIPYYIFFLLVTAACCQQGTVSYAKGEVTTAEKPSFALSNYNQPQKTIWSSQDALGNSSMLLFFAGKGVLAVPTHVELIVVASEKKDLGHLQNLIKTPETPLLWDKKNMLRQQFQLQKFGISPIQSALAVIDRAGWLRAVHKIENTDQLEKLLANIGDPTPPFQVGLPAPDFLMPDMNGVSRRPLDLKGKKYLLLTFFPKCFTGTCSKQLESLRDTWPQLQENDVEVWGVSVDPAEGEKGQRAFADFLKLPFPLLPDTGRNLSILYGAAQSPNQTSSRMSVLIDKQGIVRWIDKQINPTTHGMDVVAKVKELEDLDSIAK